MRGQTRCHWCGQARAEGDHACAQAAPPAPLADSKRPRGLPQGGPRYDRKHGLGTTARGLVLTPLGWAHVSPAALARIAARNGW
jgi:hypothetical protein